MIDVVQKPRDGCLYEIRQKGQKDTCYVVVQNTKVRFIFHSEDFIFIKPVYDFETHSVLTIII